ncbi:MAG: hypothetical protein Q4B86_06070, partial [Eubacteriales bacterium]|nr:hypothetical protein [Eubacteriales bacterium]
MSIGSFHFIFTPLYGHNFREVSLYLKTFTQAEIGTKSCLKCKFLYLNAHKKKKKVQNALRER